jgi:hypothetical protein
LSDDLHKMGMSYEVVEMLALQCVFLLVCLKESHKC